MNAAELSEAHYNLHGLAVGRKYHVRAIAKNAARESLPGPEYPIYVTGQAPLPPDGLKLDLNGKTIGVSWGQVLGVVKYRLYRRQNGGNFKVVYEGPERRFADENTATVEYQVAAVNGNGEGRPSHPVDSDPGSWLNFDPRPGEPFRRDNLQSLAGATSTYYPN